MFLELFEDASIKQVFETNAYEFTIEEKLEMCIQLTTGLKYIHRTLVHGDLALR